LHAENIYKTVLSDSRIVKVDAEKRNFLEDWMSFVLVFRDLSSD